MSVTQYLAIEAVTAVELAVLEFHDAIVDEYPRDVHAGLNFRELERVFCSSSSGLPNTLRLRV